MKIRLAVLMILFCGVVSIVAVGQGKAPEKGPTALEQSLMDAEKSFIAAAKKGDAAFFKRTLTDDFSFVSFDGQLYDRKDMLDERSAPGMDLQPYEMKVVALGDGVGIVTYNVVLRVPPSQDQGPPPRYQHFSTVWVKHGDAWKMKFLQMTASHWGDW
jgi:hypothetical protein